MDCSPASIGLLGGLLGVAVSDRRTALGAAADLTRAGIAATSSKCWRAPRPGKAAVIAEVDGSG
jgi:hypothetical protein